ncbi:hypothetical protein [Roseibium sp.]|uniref:hypothetical protein n=1 Tax=Roseibium sp. TaxID=1936156 RepID=UPI001B28D794|nr:hypothetical protein [Roseibium sp.]MBO6858362.1 hypothetical protein [Roseibium sp.]
MDDEWEGERKKAYELCAGLNGSCPCQGRQTGPCDWVVEAVENGETVETLRQEMAISRNTMQIFDV